MRLAGNWGKTSDMTLKSRKYNLLSNLDCCLKIRFTWSSSELEILLICIYICQAVKLIPHSLLPFKIHAEMNKSPCLIKSFKINKIPFEHANWVISLLAGNVRIHVVTSCHLHFQHPRSLR